MATTTIARRSAAGLLPRLHALDFPVLAKELRLRMRGTRAYLVMLAYVLTLSLFAVGFLYVSGAASGVLSPGTHPAALAAHTMLARQFFMLLAMAQLTLVIALTPALTCGTLTTEWEQRTLETLAITRLSSRSIVLGKFLAALCYVGLLLLCSVPIFALTLMLGGVSPVEILIAYLITAAAALFFGAQGVLASALTRRTYAATVMAYGLTGFWIFGFFALAWGALPVFFLGGLTLAGLTTVVTRSLLRRWRPGYWPDRALYIAVFGLTFCAVVGLLNLPAFYGYPEDFLRSAAGGLNPYQILQDLFSTSPSGMRGSGLMTLSQPPVAYTGPRGFLVILMSPRLLTFGALSVFGAVLALAAATCLLASARAPQPDSLEVHARVAAERSPDTRLTEDAS